MTRPVFDWAEADSTSVSEEPRVTETQFGDGYSQRSAEGINTLTEMWDVSIEEADNQVADEIIAFLRARGGVEVFEWTPRWGTDPILVVTSGGWKRTGAGDGASTISVRFKRVYEP